MLLLPGSLPADRATLKALGDGLAALSDVAAVLRTALVEPFSGSWSDAERQTLRLAGDLCDGQSLAASARSLDNAEHGYAIATPLHAALGLTDLTVLDPALIALTDDESRALCEAADLHLSVDGVRLTFIDVNIWLVTCTNAINVLTERPDWLIGEPLRPNLPRGKDARLVERWMNELQMLLFTHPVNAAREACGVPPINLVWLWGFGSLNVAGTQGTTVGAALAAIPPSLAPPFFAPKGAPTVAAINHLTALRNGNVPAWQAAWQKLSPEILSADSIMLGDSRPRLRLTPRKASSASRFMSLFQRKPTLSETLTALQQQL